MKIIKILIKKKDEVKKKTIRNKIMLQKSKKDYTKWKNRKLLKNENSPNWRCYRVPQGSLFKFLGSQMGLI